MDTSSPLGVRLAFLEQLTGRASHSLRLWRWIYYSVGAAAVILAALAGASSLSETWSSRTAGLLALAAAVMAGVDKFLGAGEKVGLLKQRFQRLYAVKNALVVAAGDDPFRASGAGPFVAGDAYQKWVEAQCSEFDAQLRKIDETYPPE